MATPVQKSRLPEAAFLGQAVPQCSMAGPQQAQTHPNVIGEPQSYAPATYGASGAAPIGRAEDNDFGACAPAAARVEQQAFGMPANSPVPPTLELQPQANYGDQQMP